MFGMFTYFSVNSERVRGDCYQTSTGSPATVHNNSSASGTKSTTNRRARKLTDRTDLTNSKMGDAESRRKLENALGKLLGFEEGEAEDLLEHLFTIDSDNDLSEYLVQLLGGQTPDMLDFVENMSRYRRGESIVSVDEDQSEADQKESPEESDFVSPTQEIAALDSFRAMAMGNNTRNAKKNAGRKNTKQKQGSKSRVPPPKSVNSRKNPQIASSDTVQSENVVGSSSNQNRTQHQQKEMGVVEKSHPARGKAKVVCGCFGTKYKALTNCLYCGRIICEAEGYGFCPFCGFMVEEAV